MTVEERLRADMETIRQNRDRTGQLSLRPLRWVGEPMGWRLMGDLADDIEELLDGRIGSGETLWESPGDGDAFLARAARKTLARSVWDPDSTGFERIDGDPNP